MKNLFKQSKINLGVIKSSSKNNEVFWEFDKLTKNKIATYVGLDGKIEYAIKKGCGCTVDLEVTDKGIHAKYNATSKKELITKNIVVFLAKEGVPARKKNASGILSFNTDLERVVLFFEAKIV